LEFALVLPVLLLILFGIIEYGWVLTSQIVLTNAASEGARAGIKAEDDAEALYYATKAVMEAYWLGDLDEELVVTEIIPAGEYPRRIVVEVPKAPYNPLTGFLPAELVPQTLSAQAVMAFP
jgi:hypothetical protein